MNMKPSLLAPVFALTLMAGTAQAAGFTNSTGLSGLFLTETFGTPGTPANYTPAGSLYPGMTFSSDMYVNSDFSGVPGFSGNGIANFTSFPGLPPPASNTPVSPVFVTSSVPVSAAAFTISTDPSSPSMSTFIAYLGSTPVDVFSVTTGVPGVTLPAVPMYVGFTGVTFDRIGFLPQGPVGPYMAIDNLQFVTAAIPEPETYAMMLAGLGLMGFVARRRKRAERDLTA